MKGSGIKGRPRNDGLPPIQKGQRALILGKEAAKPPVELSEPNFTVEDAATVRESMDVNGAALVNDAFRRAARAAASGDPFDKAVYLTLLGKTKPADGKAKLPGTKKDQLRQLERIMRQGVVDDAVFTPVKPEHFTGPDGPQVGQGEV